MFKMEEANMIASLELYRSQLQQVEDALSISDSTQDLEKLKTDIMELISLTEESLLSIKKSQLLQLIENEDAELKSDGAIDKEYAAFQAAVADDEEIPTEIGAAESTKQMEIRPARDSDDEDDCEILEQLKNIIGMRCRVSYMQDWGMLDYHNALVVNTEPYHRSSPAKVTVMFSNPIHKSMLPCKFYLEGKCKFSEEDCKFSHGYTVDLQVLRPFKDPDYSSVVLGSKCLARYKDGLWYKAAIESVEDDHQFVVNYDFYKETCILDLEDILPLDSLGSDSDDDEEEKGSFGSEIENELPFVLWEPPRTTTGLAEWEIHTKGIGSKLLAKMGYKLGQGLGKNGEGRAEPVPIQVLPAGKSLDKIMELKAIAKDQNLFDAMKKNKNMKRIQEKKNAAACSRVDAPNVFDFINRKLKGKKGNHSNPVPQHTVCHISHKELHRKTDHNLNVQLLKTEEEMKKVEKEIKSLEESLARHKNRNKSMTDHLQKKLESMKHYLSQLTTSQNAMEQHQKQRINHKKLTIF